MLSCIRSKPSESACVCESRACLDLAAEKPGDGGELVERQRESLRLRGWAGQGLRRKKVMTGER